MRAVRPALAAVLLSIGAVGTAVAQSCTGDCDAGQSVSVGEIVRGVSIALGGANVSACPRMDRSGNGRVDIDELVEAVANSVSGCPSQRVARASSSVALSSVRTVLNFGSISAGGGGGAATVGRRAGPLESVRGGGQGLGCQTIFCDLGGTEQTCCYFDDFEFVDVVEISRDECRFVDSLGNTVTYDGFVSLTSTFGEFDPCFEREPPFGSSFLLEFDGFTGLVEDAIGNYDLTFATYEEDFIGTGTACFPGRVDPFAFGIRGEGLRFINGGVQRIIGDASGPSFDSTSSTDGLDLDVVLFSNFNDCVVATTVDGTVEASDAITGVQAAQTYDFFDVQETPDSGGSFFLEYDGDLITDCVGLLSIETDQPLELPAGAVCPTDGRVLITSEEEQTTSAITYTSGGGVTFDVGADGSIEETRASCVDLDLRECSMRQSGRTCTSCSSDPECGAGFECASCVFCDRFESRCVPSGEFLFCGDDLYGTLFIEITS